MKRILIIEDDKSISDLEKDYLEVNGFVCEAVYTGNEGIEKALEGDYDLIILDVMLPNVDGFEVCRILRSKISIPIIMLSAKKEDIDKIKGLGLGADDYMTKPFSPNELVARVKAHISRFERLSNKEEVASEIKIRGLVIDKLSRRVYVNDEEIILTAKEFDLLLLLASNPNRVFKRDILFDRVWGLNSFGDLSTVTVHVQRLRDKIEPDNSNPQYIETVWGAGYRFKV